MGACDRLRELALASPERPGLRGLAVRMFAWAGSTEASEGGRAMFVVVFDGGRRVFGTIGAAEIFASMVGGEFVGELVAS